MNSSELSRSVEDIKIGIQDSSFFVSFNWFYLVSGFLTAKLTKSAMGSSDLSSTVTDIKIRISDGFFFTSLN